MMVAVLVHMACFFFLPLQTNIVPKSVLFRWIKIPTVHVRTCNIDDSIVAESKSAFVAAGIAVVTSIEILT